MGTAIQRAAKEGYTMKHIHENIPEAKRVAVPKFSGDGYIPGSHTIEYEKLHEVAPEDYNQANFDRMKKQMEDLAEYGIAQGDVKPDNFVSAKFEVKIDCAERALDR